jgi:hypothetical protein
MIKLKDKEFLAYSAFYVCEADPCQEEATRIWANSETRIIDLCDSHYDEVTQ